MRSGADLEVPKGVKVNFDDVGRLAFTDSLNLSSLIKKSVVVDDNKSKLGTNLFLELRVGTAFDECVRKAKSTAQLLVLVGKVHCRK